MRRRRASGQAGFIITLELVLIFTILGIGLLVGLVAIRDALLKWWVNKQAQTVWVYDSSDPVKVVGPVRDFDQYETPRLFYIDRGVEWPPGGGVSHNYRAFLGVRSNRFTGAQRLFYATDDCTGLVVCIQAADQQAPDSRLVGEVVDEATAGQPLPTDEWVDRAGGVGYLYGLQQGPSYGIGRDIVDASGLPGTLYRQTDLDCNTNTLNSTWESQRVGAACVPRTVELVVADINCPPPGGASACSGGADASCISTANSCSCPDGWFRPTGGANCCPIGSNEVPGQCRFQSFFAANAVEDSDGDPVLSNLVPPFRVNLPPDPASFVSIPPTGESP